MNSALVARRWAVIVAAGLSGVLVLVSMFVDPVPSAEGRELIQGYSDEPGRQGLHTNLIHYGFALFAPVAYGMAGLARGRGAWIANAALVCAVIGLSTLPGLVIFDYFSVGVERVAGIDTAVRVEDEVETLPGFVALLAPGFITSMLALPLAAAALWRDRLAPWWLPVVVLLGFLLPNTGVHWLIGFGAMAAVGLVLAYVLWRIPVERWHGPRPVEEPRGDLVAS